LAIVPWLLLIIFCYNDGVLKKTDPDIIKSYLEDSSNLASGYAEGVYLPENEAEISEAASECNANKVPLTISGGQTGTVGGCIPFGGWVLSTQKLNHILDFNPQEKFMIVQPGVTLEEIEKTAAQENLFYPPDPTEKTATIGGNVATNASGGRSYRFGSTRQWIERLKIVLANGTSLNLKRNLIQANKQGEFVLPHLTLPLPHYQSPPIKNSAGYFVAKEMDFLDLFIGSEGTLGIFSEIEISLLPAFQETFDFVVFFESEDKAVDFVLESKSQKDPTINFYEFFDENTLQMLKKTYSKIPGDKKAAIYLEQEINDSNQNYYLEQWSELLEKYQIPLEECWLGLDAKKKEELRKFRHAVPEHINELFKQHGLIKLATDIAVPEDKFKEMFTFYNSELKASSPEIFYIKFGHIGDNHLHVNLLPKSEQELKKAKELILSFVRKAVSLGGTVSAEHGIGKIKHDYLKEMYGEAGVAEMIRIKKAFDPNCILGRNNLFSINS